ncbi:hypothetical protein COX03_00460 [Candidatus Woesebacteria bacterium CG22_combo_CG10-13_8_21_14_all_39_10]|uniref:Uncharacterized protein n=1 Tax=Candidatus Woesebacteria bacterium CG22_combo_CG10-13_8_21_14_all_39_10 TaxID=1975059 RepID=A0A2H0BJR7_9BACT|nr:MAG: hypothetical protein COX03_00460 [Candidatus Woesebacteria bacterium CG22_combo_CG10-13_8_21_14_all_39_10]
MIQTYPAELKLTLKENKITTNVKEPYFIDLAEGNKEAIAPFSHFIIINTKGNPEDVKNLDSLFLITGDNLVVSEGKASGSYRVISLGSTLSKIPNKEKSFLRKNISNVPAWSNNSDYIIIYIWFFRTLSVYFACFLASLLCLYVGGYLAARSFLRQVNFNLSSRFQYLRLHCWLRS